MLALRAPLRRAAAKTAAPVRSRVLCSSAKRSADPQLPWAVGLGAGGFAGVVSALTGVGGGLILIPVHCTVLHADCLRDATALPLILNRYAVGSLCVQTLAKFTTLTQQAVNGTSIGAVTLSASLGAYNYFESGACNIPLALTTTLPSVVFARYGVQTAHRLSSKHLSFVVGSAMLLCSPLIALKNSQYFPKWTGDVSPFDLQLYGRDAAFSERATDDVPAFVLTNAKYAAAGCFAGFISGLCGLGGGILMTAYLTAASDMPQESIIGTSLLSIVPTAASSTYFNIRAKSIHLPTALRVGGALSAGVYLTSKYVTHQVPEDVLRGILATTLGTAALVMMRRAL
ncbi:hypothetical protein PINS_up014455 [Pythium insidiosum]|nr:hypothetical protein PINS_up014455 [Pythium insidiosum]